MTVVFTFPCLSNPIQPCRVNAQGHSIFSQTHKVGNNGIEANSIFPFFVVFFHYLDLTMLVNVKLDVSWQTSLIFLILDDTVKTKLAILARLYCGEIIKKFY